MSETDIGSAYLADALKNFRGLKRLAEGAFAQTSDADMFRALDPESNSIVVLVKHMAGNMRSRWTDFLTSDGEKPDRHRDDEFVIALNTTRADVIQWWEIGWKCVFDAVERLQPSDLQRTVSIRGEQYTVLKAINRQLLHYAGHVNQILLLAKHFRGAAWKSLSIPRGQSDAYGPIAERELAGRGEKR